MKKGISIALISVIAAGVFIFGSAWAVRTWVFTIVRVDGVSMQPSVRSGDLLIVNKRVRQFGNGDIIMFRITPESRWAYIQRIIASEGQTLYIDFESSGVYIDGERIYEPYVMEAMLAGSGNTSFGPITLPEGYFFVMGDNRNNSYDSRAFGAVHRNQIKGRASKLLGEISVREH